MPRYYFHLDDQRSRLTDEEGVTLPDAEAAWYQAVRSARELIRADLQLGCSWQDKAMVIHEEGGLPVAQIPLEEIAAYAL
jgi:hypothetical protein